VVKHRAALAHIDLGGNRAAVRFTDPVAQAGSHRIDGCKAIGCNVKLLGGKPLVFGGAVREHDQVDVQAKLFVISFLIGVNRGD
jgi:hypothetical protein